MDANKRSEGRKGGFFDGVREAFRGGFSARRGDTEALVRDVAVFLVETEERRVGKECSEPCRSRWSPYH